MSVETDVRDGLLATILRTAPVGILVIEPGSLRVLLANEHVQRILDPAWHNRDLTQYTLSDLVTDDGAARLRGLVEEVARTGAPMQFRDRSYDGLARGRTYWNYDLTPLYDETRHCYAVMLSTTETTSHVLVQQRLEERMTELATLAEVGATVSASLDFDEVVDRVLAAVAALIPHDRAFIMLDESADALRVVAARSATGVVPEQIGTLIPKATSVNGQVFRTRVPLRLADIHAASGVPVYVPPYRDKDLRAVLCVPLIARERAIGTLYLARYVTDAYTDADLERLRVVATLAAAAIANAHLYREVSARATELATLNEVTIALAGSLTLTDVLERALAEIARVVPYDAAFVALPTDDRAHLRVVSLGGRHIHELGTDVPVERSMIGRVFARSEPALLPDLSAAAEWLEISFRPERWAGDIERAILAAPLRAMDETVGVLYLARDETGAYAEADLERLLRFTPMMGVAITNARLYTRSMQQVAQLQRLNDELETLREIGIATTGTLDLPAVLRRVLGEISRVVPYEQGMVTLHVPERGTLRIEAGTGSVVEPLVGTEMAVGQSLNGYVFTEGETVCVDDFWSSEEWLARSYRVSVQRDALRSILCAPLRIGGQSIGTIYLAHGKRALYQAEDIRRIERFTNQVAVAVANARLFEQVRRQIDELRALNSELETMHEIGLAVGASLDPAVVLPRVLTEIRQIIPAESGYVTLLEPGGEVLRIVSDFGFSVPQIGERIPVANSINGEIVRSRRTLRVGDYFTDPMWHPRGHPAPAAVAGRVRNLLGTPLVVAGSVIGTLYLIHGDPDIFTALDAERLEQYAAQTAVAVANARLYEQIQSQVAELRRLNADLEAANRHKSEFLATMSHELRTPLNAIIGFSELLADDIVIKENERRECLNDIHSSARHLLALINDVLDVAKIESGKMEMRLHAFAVVDELKEVERVMTPLVLGNRQTLALTVAPGTPEIYADRARFRQIVLNVLSNANKFTPEGGRITVRADGVGDQVRVQVTDTGIGIQPEDAPKVFEAFRQIDGSLSRRYSGTGLGLALTKRLVELQHGSIHFDSEPGRGTTFTILLPAARGGLRTED